MIKQHKEILAAVIRELRHDLFGYTAKDGTPVRGDLDRELERLGVLRDGRVQPIDALPNATREEVRAHEAADRFIDQGKRQSRAADKVREEYVEQAAYSWINRLVALRALEARRLITGTFRPNEQYGDISESLYLLAQIEPARVAASDGGWWAVLEQACAAQAEALPGLFGPSDPILTLRPSTPALRRCIERIGRGPTWASVEETDKTFVDPDAIGWAYQFYQEEAKDAAFASFKAGKKADSRATIAAATQLFTEPYMVKWLLQNSLGRSYHEIHPQSDLPANWEYYIRPTEDRPLDQPVPVVSSLELLTVLDPCVGSGHFLREAFDLLVAMYREQHADWDVQRVVETILHRHLYGIDIDPRAVQLAALTLYMRALELLRDEARARRRPMLRWIPRYINLATTPSGLDAATLERHLLRHPEDRPLRPVLEHIFETLSQAEILGSLLKPSASIDDAIAEVRRPRQASMFDQPASDGLVGRNPTELRQLIFDRTAVVFRNEAGSADPADALFGREAERGVRLLQLLDRKYAVVVTNPPYMGNTNMDSQLRKTIESNFGQGKADLYAALLIRCTELCLMFGRLAMIVPQTWMFQQDFVEVRFVKESKPNSFQGLLRDTSIEAIVQLGRYSFSEVDPPNNPVLFITKVKIPDPTHYFTAIRMIEPRPAEDQANLLLSITSKVLHRHPLVFFASQLSMLRTPNQVISYWGGSELLKLLGSERRFGRYISALAGLATGDNTQWVRYWWEASIALTSYGWVPCMAGGDSKSYYTSPSYIVRWGDNGLLLRNFMDYRGKLRSRPQNTQYYGIEGLTFSKLSRRRTYAKYLPTNHIFLDTSRYIHVDGRYRSWILAALNSRIVNYILRLISPSVSFTSGDMEMIPVPDLDTLSLKNINSFVTYIVRLRIVFEGLQLTSNDFVQENVFSSQIQYALQSLMLSVENWSEILIADDYKLSDESLSRIYAEMGTSCGLHPLLIGYNDLPELPADLELPDLPREFLEYLQRHECISLSSAELKRIKLRLRMFYYAGPGGKDEGIAEAEELRTSEETGGENTVEGAHMPFPTETFLEELSVKMKLHPISIYWLLEELQAEGARCKLEERRLLEDRLSVLVLRLLGHRWPKQIEARATLPAWADLDGMMPLVNLGFGEAALAERLRERLRDEEGEIGDQRVEALLIELTDTVSLDDWLARIFWPRHVKQFKSRPVVWHLASRPIGTSRRGARRTPLFACMLYYHTTGGDSLARLRTQYVEPLLRREETALAEALAKENTEAASLTNARIQELRDFVDRLQRVEQEGFACTELDALLAQEPLDRWSSDGIVPQSSREDLQRQERAWHVDLNDGVRVNIAPLQLAGLLASDVLKPADAKKAIVDRAHWRSDERRWVRDGKLPRPGWLPESIPESPEWTRKAPERAADQKKLEDKHAAIQHTEVKNSGSIA